MRKTFILIALGLFWLKSAYSVDAFSLGGQVGLVGMGDVAPAVNDKTIGFSVDLGIKTNSIIDLVLSYHRSSHGGFDLQAIPVAFDLHVGRIYDFDFTLGAGPGFYFWNYPGLGAKFGLNYGGAVDLIVEDKFKVGLGVRYHTVFGGKQNAGSFYTVMLRLGYIFEF